MGFGRPFALAVIVLAVVGGVAARRGPHSRPHSIARTGSPGDVLAATPEGADVNARNECGRTALLNAVGFNGPPVLHALLDAGADPTATNRDGHRAIEVAKDYQRLRCTDTYRRLHSEATSDASHRLAGIAFEPARSWHSPLQRTHRQPDGHRTATNCNDDVHPRGG